MSAPVSRATHLKVKRVVWTGAIFAITVAGTLYGAGLRTRGQIKQVGALHGKERGPGHQIC